MLCFTSPTIRLVECCARQSLSSTLKFFHCAMLVSWNSSIMMCLICVPIFSYMNGASLSPIILLRSICVALSGNLLASAFASSTLSLMLPSRRSLLMCSMVLAADL